MKVTIKGKEYGVKNSLRAVLIFEESRGKAFSISTVTDLITYQYCMICAGGSDDVPSFNDFLDELDANPKLAEDLNAYFHAEQKRNEIFNDESKKKKANR